MQNNALLGLPSMHHAFYTPVWILDVKQLIGRSVDIHNVTICKTNFENDP